MNTLLTDMLQQWLPQQRWFPVKGAQFTLAPVASVTIAVQEGMRSSINVFAVESGDAEGNGSRVLIQLPLVLRAAGASTQPGPADRAGASTGQLIGALKPSDPTSCPVSGEPLADGPEKWLLYDACSDGEFIALMMAWLHGDQPAPPAPSATNQEGTAQKTTPVIAVAGQCGPDEAKSAALAEEITSLVPIAGEQSNSSIVINAAGQGVIIKFFRTLQQGRNPEVELGAVLTRQHAQDVPATLGWLWGQWDGAEHAVDLAVAHEFLRGGRDAWAAAVEAAGSGESFARQAHAIGQGTARIHRRLLEGLPPCAGIQDFALPERLIARIRESWALTRELVGPYDEVLESILNAVTGMAAAPQRIHGDLHLGQILAVRAPGDGERWVFLDFEGEPLRPIAERSTPDAPLRDVVGLLRSFDYAAGAAERQRPGLRVAQAWLEECTEAFLAGYASVAPGHVDRRSPAFTALWLDKALYEIRYEQQNRPDWLEIPLTAVRRMLDAGARPRMEGTS